MASHPASLALVARRRPRARSRPAGGSSPSFDEQPADAWRFASRPSGAKLNSRSQALCVPEVISSEHDGGGTPHRLLDPERECDSGNEKEPDGDPWQTELKAQPGAGEPTPPRAYQRRPGRDEAEHPDDHEADCLRIRDALRREHQKRHEQRIDQVRGGADGQPSTEVVQPATLEVDRETDERQAQEHRRRPRGRDEEVVPGGEGGLDGQCRGHFAALRVVGCSKVFDRAPPGSDAWISRSASAMPCSQGWPWPGSTIPAGLSAISPRTRRPARDRR